MNPAAGAEHKNIQAAAKILKQCCTVDQTGRADIRAYCALLQEYGNSLEDCFSEQKRA